VKIAILHAQRDRDHRALSIAMFGGNKSPEQYAKLH
jgi:hypothetical protein